VIDHLQEWIVVMIDVQDPDGLGVKAQLTPRHHLKQLFERAKATGHRDESLCKLGHHSFSFVHIFDDMKLLQSHVCDLFFVERLWDHALYDTTISENSFGDRPHQANASASVNQLDLARRHRLSKHTRLFDIQWPRATSRTTKYT
tara:strand:- start:8666 stop:9100 length:435 start_codon:yes stop_codon:yes gene_type:complete